MGDGESEKPSPQNAVATTTSALASDALDAWKSGSFDSCLESVKEMASHLGANEAKSKGGDSNGSSSLLHSKTRHNLALATFAAQHCRDARTLLSSLLDAYVASGGKDDMGIGEKTRSDSADRTIGSSPPKAHFGSPGNDDSDTSRSLALILYNMSVVLVHMKMMGTALEVLGALFDHREALDESVALCVSFSLLDVHTRISWGLPKAEMAKVLEKCDAVFQYLEAPHHFNGLLKAQPSGKETPSKLIPASDAIEFRYRLHLYKAKLRLLQSDVKHSKKEVKSALEIFQRELRDVLVKGVSADESQKFGFRIESAVASDASSTNTPSAEETALHGANTPALCLKANLEYLRGNYKKSVKLLTSCSKAGLQRDLFLNNMACIEHRLQRERCASLYLARAMDTCKTLPGASPYTPEILYNLGTVLLQSGKHGLAYSAFMEASAGLYNRPLLWYRMAECAAAAYAHAQRGDAGSVVPNLGGGASTVEDVSSTAARQLVSFVAGNGPVRRLHLEVSGSSAMEGGGDSAQPQDSSDADITLSAGIAAANNAIALLDERSNPTSGKADDDAALWRRAMLVKAYLLLGACDSHAGLKSAQELLKSLGEGDKDQGQEEAQVRALAHTYCAEALLSEGKLDDATEHATKAFVASSSPVADGAAAAANPKTRCALCVNIATARMGRGEWGEAEKVLHRALQLVPGSNGALRSLLYLYMRRGQTRAALHLLKYRRVSQKFTET